MGIRRKERSVHIVAACGNHDTLPLPLPIPIPIPWPVRADKVGKGERTRGGEGGGG
jgi:hypothetical protein